jgi:hypothetical protein
MDESSRTEKYASTFSRNSLEIKQKRTFSLAGIGYFRPFNPGNPFLRAQLHLLQNKVFLFIAIEFPNDFCDGHELRFELQTLRRQSP